MLRVFIEAPCSLYKCEFHFKYLIKCGFFHLGSHPQNAINLKLTVAEFHLYFLYRLIDRLTILLCSLNLSYEIATYVVKQHIIPRLT